ncbi:ARPP-1 family domain-containing protein [Pseudomonadota bacterium]
MNAIQQALSGLQLGEPLSHEGLTVHPLIRASLLGKDYLTLDEALKLNVARVTEVSESGSVPQLLFRNQGDQAVFLLDGEELVGAKQNRVLNITILAPAGKETVIPVSCVEAGRWNHSSDDFTSAPRAQYSASRAKKAARVSENLAVFQEARSDQGEVWADIDLKMSRLQSSSATSAVEKVFEDNEDKLSQYVARLHCVESQVGAVFSVKDQLTGMEFFDRADTCRLLMPKVIRSYALDAIDPVYRPNHNSGINSPQQLLELLAGAGFSSHKSVGEGEDLRFDSTPGIAGGALFARDRVVHLCVFVSAEGQRANDGGGYRTSASLRRRYRNVA